MGWFRHIRRTAASPIQVGQSGHELVVEQEQHHRPQARLGKCRQHRKIFDDWCVFGRKRDPRWQEVFGSHQHLETINATHVNYMTGNNTRADIIYRVINRSTLLLAGQSEHDDHEVRRNSRMNDRNE